MSAFAENPAARLDEAVAKVKQRVLPLFILMFIVNYLDRVNVGFIQQQLRTDLGLDSAAYGWAPAFSSSATRSSRSRRICCSKGSVPACGSPASR